MLFAFCVFAALVQQRFQHAFAFEPALEPLELPGLLGCLHVALVRQVRLLERVALEVVHLPLGGNLAVDVVVLRELPPRLADGGDVVGRRDVASGSSRRAAPASPPRRS